MVKEFFDLESDSMRVGVLTFASNEDLKFHLNQYRYVACNIYIYILYVSAHTRQLLHERPLNATKMAVMTCIHRRTVMLRPEFLYSTYKC